MCCTYHRKCEAKTKPTQPQAKTTEQLQMEEIQRLQKEAKKKLRESRKSFRKLAKSSGPVAVKYSKKPTEAHEFNFKTKGRERTKICGQQHPAAVHPNQFPMTLRSSTKGENFHPMIVSSLELKGRVEGDGGGRGQSTTAPCSLGRLVDVLDSYLCREHGYGCVCIATQCRHWWPVY